MQRKGIPQHRYKQEEIEFLKENSEKLSRQALADAFNEKFGTSLSAYMVKAACCRRGFKAASDGRFSKGMVSWCKGMSKEEFESHMSKESFERMQKGQYGHGRMRDDGYAVGTEVCRKNYIFVKVSDDKTLPYGKRWKLKHNCIWEQKHGEIPKGHMVIFKDGNPQNCTEDNLLLISRAQNAVMAKNHLHSDVPEFTETGASMAQLLITISNIERKRT